VFIILLSGAVYSFCQGQTNTLLQGEIRKSDSTLLKNGRVYLQWPEIKTAVDSTRTDSNGIFRFEKFAYGNYSIGVNVEGVDNAVADVIPVTELNPVKQNQHFKIEDESLVCIECNYSNLTDALENKVHVYILNLNNLQFDVAEKSLIIGTDGTKKLSPKIGEFINLESLSMDINVINFLPAEIAGLPKLTILSANLNKLSELPAEMESLKNLKKLNLGKNNFKHLPELITKYAALEILNFESNPIITLPPTIGSLQKLKELNLASCFELTALPIQISELMNLEVLDLSNCGKLKSLPEEIIKLKNLKVLDITGTKISTKKFQEAVPGCEVRK